ncbi:hypothetical protein AAIA72_08615 [Hahella sp. SMD15-11]|uniref:Uncharacterized protein n=1 Tax=Thermohahella caldifontis TaxID=3142973 RepID=A0AB39UST5_9GAMM
MNWGESLARYGLNGLILAAICMLPLLRHTGIRAARKKGFYGWLWAATAGWTLLAQNPEHLRHLLPVFVFACLWGLSHYRRLTAALLLAAALSGWIAAWQAPSSPPVWQAADLLGQQREGGVLLTRHGPEMLRQVLPSWRVLDPVWAGDAAVLARSGPVWRLTNRPPEMKPASVRTLPARWPTEETLYLTPPNAAEGRVFQN